MLTRQEREQNVLSLYNQGRTIREIAKEIRMSFRDIGTVLKKEEKENERQKRQLENNIASSVSDNDQRDSSSSTQAYKLFSQAKTPVEVAIELGLNEKQVTKYYREYWKLKGLHKLTIVYEEIKNDIGYFLKLHRLAKAAGRSAEDIVNLLNIANNDFPALENKYERLDQNVNHLESKELDLSLSLKDLKSQILNANQSLDYCRLSYQKEVSKTIQLYKQNMRLDALLREFKINNEEYLKIRNIAKQVIKSALSDKRHLLKLAINALIELWCADPTKFDSLIHAKPLPSTISKSTMINYTGSSSYHTASLSSYYNQNSYTENLMEIIVNGAASIYEKMVKDFTNETMTGTTAGTNSNLLPSIKYLDEQTC